MTAPKADPLAGLSGFAAPPAKAATWSPGAATAPPHQDHRITSAAIEIEEPIPANVFDFWLDTLIALKGPDILRMKGIVHVEGMEWPFVFHGVQHIFEAPVPLTSWAGGLSGKDRTSRVVVIARNIDKAELAASLDILRLRPTEAGTQAGGLMADAAELPF
jgi:G3E family GTPase